MWRRLRVRIAQLVTDIWLVIVERRARTIARAQKERHKREAQAARATASATGATSATSATGATVGAAGPITFINGKPRNHHSVSWISDPASEPPQPELPQPEQVAALPADGTDRIPFDKHKGKSWSDPTVDSRYIEWTLMAKGFSNVDRSLATREQTKRGFKVKSPQVAQPDEPEDAANTEAKAATPAAATLLPPDTSPAPLPAATNDILTIDQLAALFQFHRTTIKRLRGKGLLPAPLDLGGQIVRWSRATAEEWITMRGLVRDHEGSSLPNLPLSFFPTLSV